MTFRLMMTSMSSVLQHFMDISCTMNVLTLYCKVSSSYVARFDCLAQLDISRWTARRRRMIQ